MNKAQICETQLRVGAEADGFWGPKSTLAAQKHLLRLMPSPNPWPTQKGVTAFYGPHGSDGYAPPTKEITLPFTIYYGSTPVRSLRPHEKCADSLLAVFEDLARTFPTVEARRAAGILTYDGLYNPRKMRGGSSWSMHAWAIAIDLNAAKNGNKTHWPTQAVMPIDVMEAFARRGWIAAGAFWSRDSMHFQAARL